MADAPDDLGIPMKPARPSGQPATIAPLGRNAAPTSPPRPPDPVRPAEAPRPAEIGARPAGPSPAPRRSEADVRKLIVGREISLSGEITSCDKLIVEGSVEANLQNCHDVDIAESGLFKGSATIDDVEVRGRFEGSLIVRKRLLIRATGRVSGTIRYGQIEIECGGQITGDIQAQTGDDFVSDVTGARVAF
ncbi:MAG TPA: polymer-forming cytoskeletal protein [Stellaceae bacterium]|jgi:cytoskeletal protein CcmA (bactofilin family)|nr:polymer-forming cytoskeletal protein [Stellaceae bacterium]